jgi:hypothetical protein
MKVYAAFAAVFMLLGSDLGAEERTEADAGANHGRTTFGIEKGILVPMGDWGRYSGIGLGVLARIENRISPRLALTLNPGILFRLPFLPKGHGSGSDTLTTESLIMAGVRHSVTERVDVQALTGLNFRTQWGSGMSTGTRGAALAGGSYQISPRWSFGANLFVPNLLFADTGEDIQFGALLAVTHGFR